MAGRLDHMSSKERQALGQFGEAIKGRLGGNVVKLTVFGSKIRGEDREMSDIDVLVLVKERTLAVMDQIAEITSDLNIHYNLSLAPVVFAEGEYKINVAMASPFLRVVDQEGIPLS